jgi:hypothetical protein
MTYSPKNLIQDILDEAMQQASTRSPNWPLHLHETVGNIETRTRKCLEGCLAGEPHVAGVFLDVDKVTMILRASAAESFQATASFYESHTGFCRQWLEEEMARTVMATLCLAPVGFIFSSSYNEARPSIRKELERELCLILEKRLVSPVPSRPETNSEGNIVLKRRRGRPMSIPVETKQKAMEAKMRGAGWKEVAQLLYTTRRPTGRQVKDASKVLTHFSRSKKI